MIIGLVFFHNVSFYIILYSVEISLGDRADDIDSVPDAIPKPSFTLVETLQNPTFVVVDLETTDLSEYLLF